MPTKKTYRARLVDKQATIDDLIQHNVRLTTELRETRAAIARVEAQLETHVPFAAPGYRAIRAALRGDDA